MSRRRPLVDRAKQTIVDSSRSVGGNIVSYMLYYVAAEVRSKIEGVEIKSLTPQWGGGVTTYLSV